MNLYILYKNLKNYNDYIIEDEYSQFRATF